MPNILSIEVKGLKDIMGRFTRAEGWILEVRRQEMQALGRSGVKVLRKEAPQGVTGMGTGGLRAGIGYQTQVVGNGITLTFRSEAPHTRYVIYGTRPRTKPPPVNALRAWADMHGINVYALVKSIQKKGTSVWSLQKYGSMANKFPERAAKGMEGEIWETTRRIGNRVTQYLVYE